MNAPLTLPFYFIFCLIIVGFINACAPQPPVPSPGHLNTTVMPPPKNDIPPPVQQRMFVPPPQPAQPMDTYTLVFTGEIPVKQILSALAREAKLDVDIHPSVPDTKIVLNAIEQTLPQILERIAKQVDLRYEVKGHHLTIFPDLPHLRLYKIGYVNMNRDSTSEVTVATQIITNVDRAAAMSQSGNTGGSGGNSGGGSSGTASMGENNSKTKITNTSNNRFWETLHANIVAIIGKQKSTKQTKTTNAANPAGTTTIGTSNAPTTEVTTTEETVSDVIINAESGVITVRATHRQHEEIQKFLDQVLPSVQRQVLIEATIAEVRLSDEYQAGIDWKRISGDFAYVQSITAGNLGTPPFYSISYSNPSSKFGDISATVRMLEQFGNVKVLSSPKIMALNNQTAILKVVDNLVYFTFEAPSVPPVLPGGGTNVTLRLENIAIPRFLPVGLIMNITPQISDNDVVILNVRPTISRVIGFKKDPTPSLASAGVVSQIPEIQVREIESILKINNGDIAIIGGLMQDESNQNRDGIPVLSRLPLVGDLFSSRSDTYKKNELVIFLRPVVIKDANLQGDLKSYQVYLPDTSQPDVSPPTGLLH